MTNPPPPHDWTPEEIAAFEAAGGRWVAAGGVTSTGLRYPATSDPMANGAANIQDLADDVTAHYPSRNPAASAAVSPAGAASPAAALLRVMAGMATVSLVNGAATFAIPNGGKPWAQILYFGVVGAEGQLTPRNSNWTVATAGTVGTFYVALYVANVLAGSGAVNMQYIAIGV